MGSLIMRHAVFTKRGRFTARSSWSFLVWKILFALVGLSSPWVLAFVVNASTALSRLYGGLLFPFPLDFPLLLLLGTDSWWVL